MKKLVDKIIVIEYNELEEYIPKFPINKRFGLVVHLNNIKYEFLLNLKESSDNILVLSPSALNGDKIEKFSNRPFFSRHSWNFNESTIYFEDPTRYLYSLKCGWGIGTSEEWFLKNILDIILKISQYFNIPNEKLIFYGSSSGGFTSMQLATLVKDSLAIADCPQTDLRQWCYYWQKLKNTIFSQFTDEEINIKFAYRISIIDSIIKENYVPKVIFISTLNENDVLSQTLPFIEQLNKLPFKNNSFSRIKILINPADEHGALNRKNIFKLLKTIDYLENRKNTLNLLDDKQKEINSLKKRNEYLENQNNSIINSNSWKLTYIFRKLGKILRRI